MELYDINKTDLVKQQQYALSRNDLKSVVDIFDKLERNIDDECPVDRVDVERRKLDKKKMEWDLYTPTFTFNKTLTAHDLNMLTVGTEKPCARVNGNYYHFEMSEWQKKCLRQFLPVVRNRQLINALDGVYTWFIFTDKKGLRQVVAKRALSVQELSTKHSDIISDIKDDLATIHYAGEFLKTGDNIEINFLSGTYMAALFEGRSVDEITTIEKEVIRFLNNTFDGELSFTNQQPAITFITVENIEYTRENLQTLLDCGAEIKRFDDFKTCRKYRDRALHKINAEIAHDIAVSVWKRLGGTEPVFNYKPLDNFHIDVVSADQIFPDDVESPSRKRIKR